MKITISILTGLFLLQFGALAQFESPSDSTKSPTPSSTKTVQPKTPFREKLVLGGGLDLQFGKYTVIGLTPLLAYAVTDKLLLGSIFTYRYFKNNQVGFEYSTNTYGVSPFARYFIFKGLFAHAEYELLYGEFYYNQGSVWVDSFLVGGGYGQRIGKNGFAGIYVLWNITEDPNYQIYNNPIFRISFGVGL
jgi:hypothetical protein